MKTFVVGFVAIVSFATAAYASATLRSYNEDSKDYTWKATCSGSEYAVTCDHRKTASVTIQAPTPCPPHAPGGPRATQGHANDRDPARFEPHYTEIRSPDQVQIYEDILSDAQGAVTTGLLSAVGYVKDNRLLPHGFDKATAAPEIAVHGTAASDAGFDGSGHRLRYSVDVGSAAGPFEVDAELLYQPIGYRWAKNLRAYDAPEPQRFSGYFAAMAPASATLLAKARAVTP